jgi:hypothetical protein
MGEPAKKLKTETVSESPDGTKPIELVYFYARQPFGATPNNLLVSAKHATNGSSFCDGNGVSGICEAIMLYPSGFVVATIRGSDGNVQHVAITGGGNGKVAW